MANYIKLTATNSGALNYNMASNNNEPFQFTNIERVVLVCDSTLNPINIILPKISTLNGFTNFEVLINDNSGTAGTNPITVTVGDSDTDNILGNAGITIGTNNYKAHFYVASVNMPGALNAWEVQISSCCTSHGTTEFFTAAGTTTVFTTTDRIDVDKPFTVVVTGENTFGTVFAGGTLMPNTGVTVRDYAVADHVGGGSTITLTNGLLNGGTLMASFETTDLIAP